MDLICCVLAAKFKRREKEIQYYIGISNISLQVSKEVGKAPNRSQVKFKFYI